VYDPLWGRSFVAALQATKPGGRTVTVGRSSRELTADIPVFALLGRSILSYRNGDTPRAVIVDAFQRMLAHAAVGDLVVDIEEFPLERAEHAWALQSGSPHRKLVLRTTAHRT